MIYLGTNYCENDKRLNLKIDMSWPFHQYKQFSVIYGVPDSTATL